MSDTSFDATSLDTSTTESNSWDHHDEVGGDASAEVEAGASISVSHSEHGTTFTDSVGVSTESHASAGASGGFSDGNAHGAAGASVGTSISASEVHTEQRGNQTFSSTTTATTSVGASAGAEGQVGKSGVSGSAGASAV